MSQLPIMSAKKKEKSEWSFCGVCDSHYPRLVFNKHLKLCSESKESVSETSINSSVFVDSGFVSNSVLHGKTRCCENEEFKVPSNKNDLVLLHPSTIKLCNLQVACSVMISFGLHKTYGTVWPLSSIPVDVIGVKSVKIKSLHVAEGEFIMVQKNECFSVIAREVILNPLCAKGSENFDMLVDTLLQELDDTIIVHDDVIQCTYYGEKMEFKIFDVVHDLDVSRESKNEEVKNLCDDLTGLSITKSNQNQSIVASTPVKNGKESKQEYFVDNFVLCAMFSETKISKMDMQNTAEKTNTEVECRNALDKVGGMVQQKKLLQDSVTTPFKFPSLYKSAHISPSNGIILYGPSGVGKTFLAHSFAKTLTNVHCSVINGPELTSKYFGETENKLRTIFNKAVVSAPSILIMDEFDTICPVRTTSSNESEKRIISTLASLMDSLDPNIPFVVIAITNKLDAIDLMLRRPGRFDCEIEIVVPNVTERLDILHKLLCDSKHKLSDKDFIELSEITHGYVGADLAALCKESGMMALNGFLKSHKIDSDFMFESGFFISLANFKTALCKISPSAMKELTVDIPKVYWTDVGGQNHVKQKLKEAIEWPLKHPEVFKRLGISPPKGLLMYGPPGCSKTLMAKALATESGLNFISIKGPEIFNKYLGESERAIRDIFHKARVAAPSIVFFDEIDAIGVQRSGSDSGSGNVADRVLAQILTELDGVESLEGVIIIAATNRPDIIDSALLRPGRIDRLIHVPLPDEQTRKEIFEIQFRTIPISADVSIDGLIELSNGYSGAEICSMCREAAIFALREDFNSSDVKQHHFESVFNQIKPATSKKMLKFYDEFALQTTGTF